MAIEQDLKIALNTINKLTGKAFRLDKYNGLRLVLDENGGETEVSARMSSKAMSQTLDAIENVLRQTTTKNKPFKDNTFLAQRLPSGNPANWFEKKNHNEEILKMCQSIVDRFLVDECKICTIDFITDNTFATNEICIIL